jgi:hypothetical protein
MWGSVGVWYNDTCYPSLISPGLDGMLPLPPTPLGGSLFSGGPWPGLGSGGPWASITRLTRFARAWATRSTNLLRGVVLFMWFTPFVGFLVVVNVSLSFV